MAFLAPGLASGYYIGVFDTRYCHQSFADGHQFGLIGF